MEFKKAVRKAAKLRLALAGRAGSGKTLTALRIARGLVGAAGKIAVIDTERGSAQKYADHPQYPVAFDVLELETFQAENYLGAIEAAEKAGYDVLIIDSLSHAWAGEGGILERVDALQARGGNKMAAWQKATPLQNRLVNALLQSKCHVIVTLRTKTEWAIEEGGKKVTKLGTAPVQREGIDYEFDLYCDLARGQLEVDKTRVWGLPEGTIIKHAGEKLGETLAAWLASGGRDTPAQQPQVPAAESGTQQFAAVAPPIPAEPPAAPPPVSSPAAQETRSLPGMGPASGAPASPASSPPPATTPAPSSPAMGVAAGVTGSSAGAPAPAAEAPVDDDPRVRAVIDACANPKPTPADQEKVLELLNDPAIPFARRKKLMADHYKPFRERLQQQGGAA